MKRASEKLDFVSLNFDSLTADLSAKVRKIEEIKAELRRAQGVFESAFIAEARKRKHLPAGMTFAFSYKFGIGVALKEEGASKASSTKKFSL